MAKRSADHPPGGDVWGRAGTWLSARTALVLGVAVALAAVAALGLPRLEFATGQDSYLNADTTVARDNEVYQDLFGGQAVVTLFTAEGDRTVVDLFTPTNVAAMEAMADELRAVDGVQSVVSPLTALSFTDALVTPPAGSDDPLASPAGQILARAIAREETEGSAEGAAARQAGSLATLERLQAIPPEQRQLDDPDWVQFLLTDADGTVRPALRPFFTFAPGVEPTLDNATHAQIVTRLAGNASIELEGAASDEVARVVGSYELEGFSSLSTGAPVLLDEINDYLRGGMLTLGGIAVVVMLVVLALTFPVRTRALSLVAVLVGIVWTFGLLGFIGLDLSLVTISGLPILIGMGIDVAIQIHNRVEEEVLIDRTPDAFAETLRRLGPPLLVAVVAAVVAFMALQASLVPMIRDFGVMLAIGIVAIFVTGVAVPMAWLGRRERRHPSTPGDHPVTRTERAVMWLGSLPRAAVAPLVVAAVALFAFGILAEDAFEIQTDPEQWVDQDSAVIADLDRLSEETGSSSELGVFVQADSSVFTDDAAAYATTLALEELEQNPERLLTASSIYTTVFYLMDIPGATDLVPTGEDVRLAYEVAPEDIRSSTVAADETAANLVFRTGPSSLEERKVVVDRLRAEADPPPGIRATPSGLAVVGVALLENLEANRALLTYLALGAVALWLLVRYLSITRALLTLVPVTMAVGASSLVIAAAGFELSPLTTISGPLVVATCTEFATLILARYLEERERGLGPEEASRAAGRRTGRAFVTSALTTVGGFAVLMFSALPLLRDFGAIVTLNVAVALLSALVVQPPLLIWADRRGLLRTPAPPGDAGGAGAPEPAGVPSS